MSDHIIKKQLLILALLLPLAFLAVAAQDQCATCVDLWNRLQRGNPKLGKCKKTCKKQQDKQNFVLDPRCDKKNCCDTLCKGEDAMAACTDVGYCIDAVPTEAPVEPTDAPVEPTYAPVEPTDAPVEPTEAPVEPTEAPIAPPVFVPGIAWINEFHYDNQGADQDEFIEVAYTPDTDITAYKVILYNGNTGTVYNTIPVPAGSPAGQSINLSVLQGFSIQNGPDGMALVDGNDDVVEFLSYEGTFTATNGPASGLTSEDIGQSESGSISTGLSLQRWGTGCSGNEFDWWEPDTATPGELYFQWMTILGCNVPTQAPVPRPPSPTPPLTNFDVKVLTYNIYLGGTTDDRWKDIIKSENADIIVFTEVGNWWENNDRLLNQYLGEFNNHFSGETPYTGSTVQGYDYPNTANAIMTRFPIVQEWQLTDAQLSSYSAHDVMAWKLDVANGDKFVYVFGIHLKCCGGDTEDERRNQTMRYLLDWIDQNTSPNDGVMLMGDFNSVSPVDTDPSFPGYRAGFRPSSGSNLNDGPMRMLLDSNEQYASNVHTFVDAFREANPECGANPNCCADTICDPGLPPSCPERGYTYVYDTHNVDSRIDFIVVNQAIQVTGVATSGDLGGREVCEASDHLPVDAIVTF